MPGVRRVEWRFHSGQMALWESEARWNACAAGRRWGKSESASRWIMRGAYQDAKRGLKGSKAISWIVTPTQKQGRILWRKCLEGDPGWITDTRGSDITPIMIMIGGATIEFHTAAAFAGVVGEGIRRLLTDESGEIPEQVWRQDLRPTLIDYAAPGLFIGTPKGRRSWFWEMYSRGLDPAFPEHATFGGPSAENPYIPESEIVEIAKDMTDRLYRQEILAEFLSMEGAVFRDAGRLQDPEWISGAGEVPGRLNPELNLRTEVLGIDLGRRSSFTVLHGLGRGAYQFLAQPETVGAPARPAELTRWRTTWWDRFQKAQWTTQKARIKATWIQLGRPLVVVDATHGSVGDPTADDLEAMGIGPLLRFEFTGPSRRGLLDRMIVAVENAETTLPAEPTCINEFDAFELKSTKSGAVRYEVPETGYDDCVFAAALAMFGADQSARLGTADVGNLAEALEAAMADFARGNPYDLG